jgi:hypothetical protein
MKSRLNLIFLIGMVTAKFLRSRLVGKFEFSGAKNGQISETPLSRIQLCLRRLESRMKCVGPCAYLRESSLGPVS